MFIFTKDDDDKEKFILLPIKKVYTIGRLSTDLILSEDLSISRTHVRLTLPSAGSDEALTVFDLGSKYGTYINDAIKANKKMQVKTAIPIQVGDKIRLGALKNVWKLTELKPATTPSSLARSELEELQQLLQPLGGALLSSWTKDCTHLTMNNVTVTVKLLHALLDNKPIVNVAFWRAFSKVAHRVHVTEDWPNPKDFSPSLPSDMPSIDWNPNRITLFAGKTFVFCNRKHLDIYGPVVQKAGGACKDLNSGVRSQFLTKIDVVVIQYVPSTQSQATESIHRVQDILEQAGRRLIPDYEIGLAVLHCSIDRFCNPAHKMLENSLPTTESMNSSILIPNTERTQTETNNTNKETEFVISESEVVASGIQKKSDTENQLEKTKSMLTMPRKRNNVMFVDSSDEELPANKPSSSKTSTTLTEAKSKPKRKLPIIVDSSDEDNSMPLSKISKTKPGDKSKQTTVNKAAEKEELSIELPSISPRRSTRSNPVQQQQVKDVDNIPQISPRRSVRGKQTPAKEQTAPQIDEVSEEEEEAVQASLKKKEAAKPQLTQRTKLTVPLIDEDSDDEQPFQFPRKTTAVEPTTSNNQSTNKSVEKTIPITKPKINVVNFLQKSQNPVVASQSVAAPVSQPRKRLRLKQLNESDSDDDENPFQFASKKKAKTSLGGEKPSDELFAFKTGTQKNKDKEDDDSVSTEPFIPERKPQSRYIVPKVKEHPVKINISGWLSCSRLHEDIKPKTDPDLIKMDAEPAVLKIKEEIEDCDEKVAHLKYIESMKDSIQVRMCNLNITVRSYDETKSIDTTDSKNTGRKNFKKFVKKQCLHPHIRVLPLKRMQLAEGMVKVL